MDQVPAYFLCIAQNIRRNFNDNDDVLACPYIQKNNEN